MPTIASRLRTLYDSIVLLVNSINSISAGKADKVASPTEGNFAGLDATGNITDSGYNAETFGQEILAIGDIADITPNEIIKMLWDGDVAFEDLVPVSGEKDYIPVDSETNLDHFNQIFNDEE